METLHQKTARLMQLLMKERALNPDIMQRVAAHCVAAHGKKLSEYLANGTAESEKNEFLDALIVIVEQRQFQNLTGTVPEGQTKSAPEKPVKVVKPAPTPEPESEETEEPEVDDEDTTHTPLINTTTLTKEDRIKLDIPANKPTGSDAAKLLAESFAALTSANKGGKGLSEADVERIVDQRVNNKLAEIFATIAQVLGDQKG